MSPAELDEKTVLQDPTVPLDPIGLQAQLEYYKRKCRELELASEIKEDTYVWDAETETRKKRGHDNVWLFVPNLTGYIRVLYIGVFLKYVDTQPLMALTFYGLSCILDVFDGVFARYFDQCSQFGAVLDMITDRCTTTFLFFSLAASFPEWKIWFQVFCALDWVSHYVHMRATATSGKSHKSIEAEQSWTMSLYYTNKLVLFGLCFMNEAFFMLLYVAAVQQSSSTAQAYEVLRHPFFTMTVPWLARLTFPGMVLKQLINIVQLSRASQWLVAMDVEARHKKAG